MTPDFGGVSLVSFPSSLAGEGQGGGCGIGVSAGGSR